MVGRCAVSNGNYTEAEAGLREGLAIFEETGAEGRAGWAKAMLASLELHHGNVPRAEELARDAIRRLRATQEHGFLVEAERTLAEVLVAQGRVTEAERVAEHARKTVGAQDIWSRASTLHALGLVRAAQGRQAGGRGADARGARHPRADDVQALRRGRPRLARPHHVAGPGARRLVLTRAR